MSSHDARRYLLSKPGAISDYPFGPDVEVLKVCDKMFATLSMNDGVLNINLKSDPHEAVILRDIFPAVLPGYHMNKLHWNTVILDGSMPPGEIERMIDNSYALVVKGLKKAQRQALEISHPKHALYGTVDSNPSK